jgi:hypothetical protein
MKPGYTITLLPSWRSATVGEHLALEMISATLWPLQHDQRMTVAINLLAAEIDNLVENDDQIDAIIDLLRMQLKLSRAA